ncbi:MAG: arginine--tRNA ligase [Solirubrobacterales bacterium]
MNLIDDLRAALRRAGLDENLSIAPLKGAGSSDLAVIVQRADDVKQQAADAAAVLTELPEVASVKRAGQRLLVRFDDEVVAALGAELESGDPGALDSSDLFAGRGYIVEFCDANTTKGLHIGHLRNIAIGQSIACALEAAGAEVDRQTQISDAGQQMGEAMAGYLSYAEGLTPEQAGQKGDLFVGELYARYARENSVPTEEVAQEDLPVAREMVEREDQATALLREWSAGEEEATALFQRIRDWVVAGQRETLARLGIAFSRPLFESSYTEELAALAESGLEAGVFSRADNGALIYETGREDYPVFPLARPDGFSTLNFRALTIWHELMPECVGTTTIHVVGIEWRQHTVCVEEIFASLRPDLPALPTHDILHGMVSTERGVASSSEGNVALVDDLLDELATSPIVAELAIAGRPGCEADDLAVLIALGFFLDHPTIKPMTLTKGGMLDERTSTGLVLARALTRAWDPEADGAPDPRPDDPVYRFAVMQSQVHRQLLRLALEQIDMLGLVRYLARFSEWYLEQPPDPRTARVMRSLLGAGLRSLGLLPSDPALAAAHAGEPRAATRI